MARPPIKLSVIVPAFNEAETIALVLERVAALDLDIEIIVVDDSSTDRTLDAISEAEVPGVRVVRHPVNQGKGAAVRTGLAEASGEVIVIQDADLEYHPNDFVPMLKLIEAGETRVVYGYRDFSSQRFVLRAGNQALTMLTNLLYGVAIRDMETCYKMWRREVLEGVTLQAESFDLEVELTAAFVSRGERIAQVPISYEAREEKKKLRWWVDGPEAVIKLIRYRFFP
ncbi:MAG: glycosyltransferase family 2 protein [Chloroflexota bacterium]|nr:glycosyltransferase family 2 protein [Chloroflexota bacterium]